MAQSKAPAPTQATLPLLDGGGGGGGGLDGGGGGLDGGGWLLLPGAAPEGHQTMS